MSDFSREARIVAKFDGREYRDGIAILREMQTELERKQRLQKDHLAEGKKISREKRRELEREGEALKDLKSEYALLGAGIKGLTSDYKDHLRQQKASIAETKAESRALKSRLQDEVRYNTRSASLRRKWRSRKEAFAKAEAAKIEAIEKAHQAKLLRVQKLGAKAILADKKIAAQREKDLARARSALVVSLRRAQETKETQVVRRGEATRARIKARSSGVSAFGGLGAGGGFGYLMGGGAIGGAIVAGLAVQQGVKKTTSLYLEQEEALGRLMSLVSDTEKAQGFAWEDARKNAQDLAMQLGITIPEAAIAMREAITSAVDPVRAPSFVKAAQGLALSEGVDVENVTALLATVRNAFELTGDEMARLPDIIFTTMDEGRFKLSQVANQLGDLAGLAAAVGFEYKETFAALGALTRTGMSSARAATSLRALSELIMKGPTKKVADRREKAGLDLRASAEEGGLTQVIADIKRAVEQGEFTTAELLGGRVQALKGVQQLIAASNDDFHEIIKKLDTSTGRAALESERLLGNTANRMERLGSTLEVGMSKIGEVFTESFANFLGEGDEFTNNMNEIVQALESVAVGLSATMKVVEFLNPGWKAYGKVKDIVVGDSHKQEAADAAKTTTEFEKYMKSEEYLREQAAAKEKRDRIQQHLDRVAEFERMSKEQREIYNKSVLAQFTLEQEEHKKALEAKKKAEIKHAHEVSRLRQSVWSEEKKRMDEAHKKMVELHAAKTEFSKSEKERLESALLSKRTMNPLEQFTRQRKKFEEGRKEAAAATDLKGLEAAMSKMAEASTAIRGMDLSQIDRSQRYEAQRGLADIHAGTPFKDVGRKSREASVDVQQSFKELDEGRFSPGGFEGYSRSKDESLVEIFQTLVEKLRLSEKTVRTGAEENMRALENFDPTLRSAQLGLNRDSLLQQAQVATSKETVYDQRSFDIKFDLSGTQDHEELVEKISARLRVLLDQGKVSITPAK